MNTVPPTHSAVTDGKSHWKLNLKCYDLCEHKSTLEEGEGGVESSIFRLLGRFPLWAPALSHRKFAVVAGDSDLWLQGQFSPQGNSI